jgi:hypothetical protein
VTAATTEPRDVPHAGERQTSLWFGALGGAFAWLVHLISCYAIAEFGCVGEVGHVILSGISVVAWMCVAATALTLLVALAATFVAYRHWPRATSAEPAAEWLQPIASAGTFLSGFFAIAILFESIPIVYYLKC